MICNCCHALTGYGGYGCDNCGEICCENCLSVQYSNFSYWDGGVDIDYVCNQCKGCVIIPHQDLYARAFYESIVCFPVPEYGQSNQITWYLFLRRIFFFRHPSYRELPQFAESKTNAFCEKYQISPTTFYECVQLMRLDGVLSVA